MRRLAAMAREARLRVLQPIPYFPIVRPLPNWAQAEKHTAEGENVFHAPMFYVPKFLKTMDSYWLYRSVIDKLTILKSKGRLDIIDAHFGYPDGVGCFRAAKELDVPVVITFRGVEEDYMRHPEISKQIARMLHFVDGCICVSYSLRNMAIEAGANRTRVHVIHNAVNRSVFAPGDQSEARSILGVTESERLVVSIGNLLSVKRHDVLISAFAQLQCTVTNARLAIIGGSMHEQEHPRQLRELCDRLGISERVTFVGRIGEAEVATWLRAADVFALASRREGCCNAVLEALASGLPVVATSVGDNAWFVRDGDNGYLVPVGQSDAMARALGDTLARRDWDRPRISSELQVGDWGTTARKVLDFLDECVGERRKPH
jgi:glycosyltransferase involved in cell wall biosynthesis